MKVIDGWLLEVVKSLEADFRVKYIPSFLVLNAFTLHLPDGSEPSQRRPRQRTNASSLVLGVWVPLGEPRPRPYPFCAGLVCLF